ncbi:TolC family protein, partial [candidate division KSB1 bacterium]
NPVNIFAQLTQLPQILTFEEAAAILLKNSYSMNDMEQDLRQKHFNNLGALARLKSRVDMEMTAPELKDEREEDFNQETQLFDVFQKQSIQYDTKISLTQPLASNGKISGNFNLERFNQSGRGTNYTTSMYMRLDQPLFKPNDLQRSIYKTELGLERTKLDYISSRISIIYGQTFSRRSGFSTDELFVSGSQRRSGGDLGALMRAMGGGGGGGGDRGGGGGGFGRRGSLSQEYYTLYENEKILDYCNFFLNLWEEQLQVSRDMLDAGELSERQFLQIQVEHANSKDRVTAAVTRRDRSKRALIQFLSLDPDSEFDVIDKLEYDPIEISLEKAVEEGLKNNTGILRFQISIINDSMDIDDEITKGKLTGDLSGTFGLNNSDDVIRMYYDDFDQTKTFSLGLKKPVWDWGRNQMSIESKKIKLETAKRQLQNDIIDTERQILGHVHNINTIEKKVDLINRAMVLAEKGMNIGIQQFRAGELSAEDLILGVNKYFQTRVEYLQLVIDYKTALISLSNQTQWDFENNKSLKDEVVVLIDNILKSNRL